MKKILLTVFALLFITMLIPDEQVYAEKIKDVTPNSTYYETIQFLKEQGALDETNEDLDVNGTLTRGDYAQLVAKAMGYMDRTYPNPKLKDVKTTDPQYPYIAALAYHGAVTGYTDKTFRTNAPVLRSEMAILLVKGFDMKLREPLNGAISDVSRNNYAYPYITTLQFHRITINNPYKPNEHVVVGHGLLFLERTIQFLERAPHEYSKPISDLGLTDWELRHITPIFDDRSSYVNLDRIHQELVVYPRRESVNSLFNSANYDHTVIINVNKDLDVWVIKPSDSSKVPANAETHTFDLSDIGLSTATLTMRNLTNPSEKPFVIASTNSIEHATVPIGKVGDIYHREMTFYTERVGLDFGERHRYYTVQLINGKKTLQPIYRQHKEGPVTNFNMILVETAIPIETENDFYILDPNGKKVRQYSIFTSYRTWETQLSGVYLGMLGTHEIYLKGKLYAEIHTIESNGLNYGYLEYK